MRADSKDDGPFTFAIGRAFQSVVQVNDHQPERQDQEKTKQDRIEYEEG
ncbi:MAG: hypothetical protein BWY72_02341 [Bacteroidetes bacterium ADurb.Bin416]|nr:MAG: hypothetical protein BWY72_02341 [Bacteroidetes bacterium ADurb.Bin416]